MLLLGLAALFQIVFLPGFLLIYTLRMNDGAIKSIVLSFALSLTINYFLVVILVFFHLYNVITVFIIFALEILCLLYLTKENDNVSWLRKHRQEKSKGVQFKQTCSIIAEQSNVKIFVILIAGVTTALFFYHPIFSPQSTIFVIPDAVLRWNNWAMQWASGLFPLRTWNYPQLLPINWSLTYVFLQTNFIQLFAKVLIPLFPIAILLEMFDLFFRKKDFGYIFSVLITAILMLLILRSYCFQGDADLACSFMAFTALYLLFISDLDTSLTKINRNIIIGAFITAGAALTKQAGVYFAIIYPYLAFHFVLRQQIKIPKKNKIILLIIISLLLFTLILSTYLFMHTPPAIQHLDANNIVLSGMSFYRLTFIKRLIFAVQVLLIYIPSILLLFVIPVVLVLSIFLEPFTNCLLLLYIIPYLFIWALFVSYDLRNLAILIPILGMICGLCIDRLFAKAYNRHKQSLSKRSILFIILLCFITIFARYQHHFDSKTTKAQITAKYMFVGDKTVNQILYVYFSKNRLKGKVLSNYPYLFALPSFENQSIYYNFIQTKFTSKVIQKINPEYILLNKIAIMYWLSNLNSKQQDSTTIQAAKNEVYSPVNLNKHTIGEANQFIKWKILNLEYVQNHYKIVVDQKGTLLLKHN